jgi:hypothetical protein
MGDSGQTAPYSAVTLPAKAAASYRNEGKGAGSDAFRDGLKVSPRKTHSSNHAGYRAMVSQIRGFFRVTLATQADWTQIAVAPPSTASAWPVVKAAWSLHR